MSESFEEWKAKLEAAADSLTNLKIGEVQWDKSELINLGGELRYKGVMRVASGHVIVCAPPDKLNDTNSYLYFRGTKK